MDTPNPKLMTNEKLLKYIDVITCDLQGRYRVDGETATEAVYRAFARVWDKDYDPQAFFQYFRVAAKNELIRMFYREDKYPVDREMDLQQELVYEPEELSNDIQALDRIGGQLPEVYKELFRLLREGIDHREIANRLNKSHGAVRVMKTRMIQYCQAVLVALLLCFTLPLQAQDTLTVQDAQIIAPNLYQTLYDTVTHHDSTSTIIKNDLPVLKDVSWQHEKAIGGAYNLIHVEGTSYSDSLEFEWFGDALKKKTIRPGGNFSFTVKTKYLGKANIILRGHDSLWTVQRNITLNTAFLDTLGGQTSITEIEVMALADTPYITVPWSTTPGSDLTDYVGYYDLSDAPQSWWDAVENADEGKFRVAKDDAPDNDTSATELAFEIVGLDTVGQGGHLWFRWSGTTPATSPDDLRIYASQDSYTSYGVTDTFGRNAVWVNYDLVSHMGANFDVDAAGNFNNATYTTAPTSVTGKFGDARELTGDGSNLMTWTTSGTELDTSDDMYWTSWIAKSTAWGGDSGIFEMPSRSLVYSRPTGFRTYHNGFDSINRTSPIAFATDGVFRKWEDLKELGRSPAEIEFRKNHDEVVDTAGGDGLQLSSSAQLEIGGSFGGNENFIVDEFRYSRTIPSFDYRALEYANQNDPATFWGTPVFVAAGGGGTTEVSFSLNSAANVSSSSTSIAEAGISLNADADVSDGSTATGESDLTISHIQQASTQSTSQAESSFSLASLLQIAFDKQSITDASFSLPTVHQVTTVSDTQEVNEASFSLALQKAISTEQISTIEVSYSLNATQQAAMASDATGEAAMSMSLQAGLSLVSTALAEAEISFDAVQSMTITGQAVGVEVTLSDGRTLTIKLQNRTFTIAQDNRTYIIPDDNRTLNIDP